MEMDCFQWQSADKNNKNNFANNYHIEACCAVIKIFHVPKKRTCQVCCNLPI